MLHMGQSKNPPKLENFKKEGSHHVEPNVACNSLYSLGTGSCNPTVLRGALILVGLNTPPETVPLDRTNGAARPLKWCMVTADMVH